MVYRNIGGIPPVGYCKPTAAKRLLRRVECIPAPANVGLEPGVQVHGLESVQESDHQACGDADAAAQRDTEMGKITAHPLPSCIHFYSG